jgi:peptidoglycan hydrolase-like protein with peptidoglycan-binding domain
MSLPYPGKALRYGQNGPDIAEVQIRLRVLGYGPITSDGVFGPKTLSIVKEFQTQRNLEADGVIGKLTWSQMFGLPRPVSTTPPNIFFQYVIEFARRENGTREMGVNAGPVEKYQRSTGNKPGDPYCMSYVYWCFEQGAKKVGRTNPLVKTAGVIDHWERAPDWAKLTSEDVADDIMLIGPGTIFIIDHGNGRGHGGLVLATSSDGLDTSEGNTNKRGVRDGQGVYERNRRFSEINGYIDYSRKP